MGWAAAVVEHSVHVRPGARSRGGGLALLATLLVHGPERLTDQAVT
ncbi:hypothetical protein ABZX39_22000 [Streptomyces collinus]